MGELLSCCVGILSWMLSTLAGGASLCGVVALLLLIISTSTDHWIEYGEEQNKGLWRICSSAGCDFNPGATDNLALVYVDIIRASMLLSVLGCLTGVVLGISAREQGQSRRVRIGGIALLLSGFLALSAMVIYTVMSFIENNKKSGNKQNGTFAWSYKLGWVSTISALAAGTLQLYANKDN